MIFTLDAPSICYAKTVTTFGVVVRFGVAVLLGYSFSAQASLTLSPWIPIFKGIDRAAGTNVPDGTTPIGTLQVINAARVDLSDPDVQLFTTPRANPYVEQSRETLSLTVSNFLRTYGLQLACDANFYGPNSDPSSEGVNMDVEGLFISQGTIVSRQDNSLETTVLMFTTNKQPLFVFDNQPPGTNTAGIYTAVCGHYPLIINGQSVANDGTSPIPGPNPRTAFGVSQDKRYLYILVIDGRQSGYSDGAVDSQTVYWLQLLGAYNAINMDGGGSTVLDMADCAGNPHPLSRSSYVPGRNRERYIGAHFGVYAKPLPSGLDPIEVLPGVTTATIKWHTPVDADSQVDYGPISSFDFVASDPRFSRNHVLTLPDLTPNTRYYFEISSRGENDAFQYACEFRTTSSTSISPIYGITNPWKYTTNNQDGTTWKIRTFNDASWLGPGPGLLYVENNTGISPKSTPLPYSANTVGSPVTGIPVSPTYYFRTHFNFSGSANGVTLYFTNYLDDAAVFYLNGTEIQRIRMTPAPATISYTSIADPPNIGPCGVGNEATCPDVFTVSGNLITNLLSGDNVVAVELHQAASTSNDAVFGSTLSYSAPAVIRPTLNILLEGTTSTLYWNGSGFTLQYADDPGGEWTDVPGPVTASTFVIEGSSDTKFFRLRN
jgi:hypothetical protein